MYLSKLTLNLRNRQVQKEMANRYELHRTIMKAFSTGMAQEERILFRLEQGIHTAQSTLLVQSTTMPDWQVLTPGYLLEDAQLKPYDPSVTAGQVLLFRLLANPTKRITLPSKERADGQSTSRVRLLKEDEQEAWLQRKAAANGFRLIGVRSVKQPDVVGSSRKAKRSAAAGAEDREDLYQKITLQAVQFDGVLEVTDPDALLTAVKHGIGPAKGFGCGLLSLARTS